MKKSSLILTGLLLFLVLQTSAQLPFAVGPRQLDSLKTLAAKPVTENDTLALTALLDIAGYYRVVNFDSAFYYGEIALKRSRETGHWEREIMSLEDLVTTHIMERKDFTKAFVLNQEAEKLSASRNYAKGLRMALISAGTIYRMIGDYDNAVEHYLKALKHLESGDDKRLRAQCLFYLGLVYARLKDRDNSVKHFEASLKLSRELKLDEYVAGNLVNLFTQADETPESFAKTITWLEEALAIYERLHNQVGAATVLQNFGYLYQKNGDLAKAKAYAMQSLAIRERMKNENGIKDVHQLLSVIYRAEKKFKQAIESDLITLKVAEKIKDLGDIVQANEHLSLCYTDLGEYKQALFYANERLRWQDSLLSFEKFSKINQLETSYAIEREQERVARLEKENALQAAVGEQQAGKIRYLILSVVLIAFAATLLYVRFRQKSRWLVQLQEKNTTIEKQNASIKEQNTIIESINHDLRDRALRAQMNPHFIFNALSSIQYLVFTQQTEEAFQYLASFATLLRKVLEHSEKQHITLDDEVEILELYIRLEALRFRGNFDYSIDVAVPHDASARYSIPPMTIQPFVENAILHGLQPKREGKRNLNVVFAEREKSIVCQITDNGIGREQAQQMNAKNRSKHISFGHELTRSRFQVMNALNGGYSGFDIEDMTDEQGAPAGTRVTLEFAYEA